MDMTEPDSTLFEENDNAGWLNAEDSPIPNLLPTPMLYRMLILPVQPKKISKGGILLPSVAQDAEGHLQFVGRVAAMGPLAYRSFKHAGGLRDWFRILTGRRVHGAPKVGDWVVYGRYSGQRCEYFGTRLIMLNDDELLARTPSASGFRIHY